MFQALVQIESNSLPQAPQRAISRTYPAVPQRDEDIEMKPLTRPAVASPSPSGPSTPHEERDLVMSIPGTPGAPERRGSWANPDADVDVNNIFEVRPSLTDPPMNKYRYAACCVQTLLSGLTDSAPGALIPYMEK